MSNVGCGVLAFADKSMGKWAVTATKSEHYEAPRKGAGHRVWLKKKACLFLVGSVTNAHFGAAEGRALHYSLVPETLLARPGDGRFSLGRIRSEVLTGHCPQLCSPSFLPRGRGGGGGLSGEETREACKNNEINLFYFSRSHRTLNLYCNRAFSGDSS